MAIDLYAYSYTPFVFWTVFILAKQIILFSRACKIKVIKQKKSPFLFKPLHTLYLSLSLICNNWNEHD